MKTLEYKLYAEDIHHNTFDETDINVSFVYLHGDLERENGFDLIATNEPIEKCDLGLEDDIYFVTIIFPNGREEKCYLYYWHDHSSKAEFIDWNGEKVPYHQPFSKQHGLICRVSDVEANEDAMQKFNERRSHL